MRIDPGELGAEQEDLPQSKYIQTSSTTAMRRRRRPTANVRRRREIEADPEAAAVRM
jgi:hypothetical protein